MTLPKSPRTNGMTERLNGRTSHVLDTNHFESGEGLERTLGRDALLYNDHLPQKALSHDTPTEALKRWKSTKPKPLLKQMLHPARPDILVHHLRFKDRTNRFVVLSGRSLLLCSRIPKTDIR
jgi:hypothetical protein